MKIANEIAADFGNDGQNFTNGNGADISDICEYAAQRSTVVGSNTNLYEFWDGSAIAISDAWDIRAKGCKNWCWESCGCQCDG